MEISGNPNSNRLMQEQLERDSQARRQAQETERAIKDAEIRKELEISRLKDTFEKQVYIEKERQSNTVDELKKDGYDRLKKTKKQLQNEERTLKKQGERELKKIEDHYGKEIRRTEKEGETELKRLQTEHRIAEEHEAFRAKSEAIGAQQLQEHRINTLVQVHSDAMEELRVANKKQLDDLKTFTEVSTRTADLKFQEKMKAQIAEQSRVMNSIYSRAQNKLNDLRQDLSVKLAAYETRQSDPFYQMQTLNAEVTEIDDAFILIANVPEHERERVSVSMQGDRLKLQVARSVNERQNLGPGHDQVTTGYQTIAETFPIPFPVREKEISRTFDGDLLIATIPKKTRNLDYKPKQRTAAEIDRAFEPTFPKNIPYQSSKAGAKPIT